MPLYKGGFTLYGRPPDFTPLQTPEGDHVSRKISFLKKNTVKRSGNVDNGIDCV